MQDPIPDNWRAQCLEEYLKEEPTVRTWEQGYFGRFSNFARYAHLNEIVHQKKHNLLVVGQAANGGQSYDLVEAYAFLESYNCKIGDVFLVEKFPGSLDGFIADEDKDEWDYAFRIDGWNLTQWKISDKEFKKNWRWYLEATEQSNLYPPKRNWEALWAKYPKSLIKKIQEGDLIAVYGDIATCELPKAHFDIVICRSVLYQILLSGRKLALDNISQSMKPGALLFIGPGFSLNEATENIPDIGPWYDEAWQQSIGLRMLEYKVDDPSFSKQILRKE